MKGKLGGKIIMAFQAQRDGVCIRCNGKITKGEMISWNRTSGGAWHSACQPAGVQEAVIVEDKGRDNRDDIQKALAILTQAMNKKETGAGPSLGEEEIRAICKEENALTETLNAIQREEKMRALALKEIETATGGGRFVSADQVRDIARKEVDARAVKTLIVKQPERPDIKIDLSHKNLDSLVKLVNTLGPTGHRLNVYMYGPAGSGKSTASRQSAQALGLKFGYMSLNPMTAESRAIGFIHAGGSYVPTEFFKCYTEGGVFCFDEVDNASASFLTMLNSMLENGHGAFPHGVFTRHPDFVCVCTANTIGRGGDIHYPERRALDSAFLERFVFIEWGYDEALTRAVVKGIFGGNDDKTENLIAWVDRKAEDLRARFPELVISPRAYIQSATLSVAGFTKEIIENACIRRGLKND